MAQYFGEREKEKLDRSRARVIFGSTMAKLWPRHIRFPITNGMYKCGNLHAPAIPFTNLSELKLVGVCSPYFGSVCRARTKAQKLTPFGIYMSPSLMSLKASLDITGPRE